MAPHCQMPGSRGWDVRAHTKPRTQRRVRGGTGRATRRSGGRGRRAAHGNGARVQTSQHQPAHRHTHAHGKHRRRRVRARDGVATNSQDRCTAGHVIGGCRRRRALRGAARGGSSTPSAASAPPVAVAGRAAGGAAEATNLAGCWQRRRRRPIGSYNCEGCEGLVDWSRAVQLSIVHVGMLTVNLFSPRRLIEIEQQPYAFSSMV